MIHSIRLSDNQTLSGRSSIQGFSLIEISIVILIIAMLVAGVLMGRNLIKSSEIKDAMVDMDYYTTATKTFQDKYNALPGDFTNATGTWGAADPTPATCTNTASFSKLTCDGNGNGRLELASEYYLIWKHLSNAGLIKGSYMGIADSVGGGPSTRNIPKGTMDGLYITAGYLDFNPTGTYFPGTYGNYFGWGYLTRIAPSTTNRGDYPLFSTADAQEIDNKMDDGRPGTGIVRSYPNSSTITPNCATSAAVSTADYNLTYDGRACSLLYIPGF